MNKICRAFSSGLLVAAISAFGYGSPAMAGDRPSMLPGEGDFASLSGAARPSTDASGMPGGAVAISDGSGSDNQMGFSAEGLRNQQDIMTKALRRAYGPSSGPERRVHALFDVETTSLDSSNRRSRGTVAIDLVFGGEGAQARKAYPFQFVSTATHPVLVTSSVPGKPESGETIMSPPNGDGVIGAIFPYGPSRDLTVAVMVERLETDFEHFGNKEAAVDVEIPVQKSCAALVSMKLHGMKIGQSVSLCENVKLRLASMTMMN